MKQVVVVGVVVLVVVDTSSLPLLSALGLTSLLLHCCLFQLIPHCLAGCDFELCMNQSINNNNNTLHNIKR